MLRLTLDGVDHTSSIPAIGPRVRPSFEQDFLVNYPKTSIANLVETVEDGIYVVSAVVGGLVDDEEWWYPACRCQRSVTADSGAYYCKLCVKHVFKMVPRFEFL
jgi:replication factor A1